MGFHVFVFVFSLLFFWLDVFVGMFFEGNLSLERCWVDKGFFRSKLIAMFL